MPSSIAPANESTEFSGQEQVRLTIEMGPCTMCMAPSTWTSQIDSLLSSSGEICVEGCFLQTLLDGHEVAGSVRAINQAMVVGQGEIHH